MPTTSWRWSRGTGRSSPSTTSTGTTPCWCSCPGSTRSPATSSTRCLPRLGGPAPPRRWSRSSMPKVDPGRLVAFEVLRAVSENDAYANLELSRLLRERRLSGRDAALATELVSGTLRLQGSYDDVIDRLATGKLDAPVRDALRLGAHQLLSMRVPTHAAVATTVDLVKDQIGHRPAGLVNAVLRKISAKPLEEWLADRPIAARTSHP